MCRDGRARPAHAGELIVQALSGYLSLNGDHGGRDPADADELRAVQAPAPEVGGKNLDPNMDCLYVAYLA